MVPAKTETVKVKVVISVGRIGIGAGTVRDAPPTVGGFVSPSGQMEPQDPWGPWTVFPILVDGREVIALNRTDARRFAQALLNEVTP